jgi:uncharacterized RDD family membrane protein YckC
VSATGAVAAPVAPAAPTTYPPAELDRRFYAFAVDRLIAWTVVGVAFWLAWRSLIAEGRVWTGLLLVVLVMVLLGVGSALLLGLRGVSPGKALLGLRVVHLGTGTSPGLVPALLRTAVLGVAALPTFGLGLATLAWTALADPGRQRRGWHDHLTEMIVVDVRPAPVEVPEEQTGPRHIVNLTAMRLVPAKAAPRPEPQPTPAVASRQAPGAAASAPHPAEPSTPPSPPQAPATPAARAEGRHSAALGSPLRQPGPTPPAAPVPPAAAPPSPTDSDSATSTAERTLMRDGGARALARWRVSFDTGEDFLVEGLVLVGRRPEPRPGEPVRHLVPLASQDMSLSKTHAQLQVAPDGVLVAMDRGSTNGSVLVRKGVSRDLPAGKPTTLLSGDQVRFGDRRMTVTRES